MDGQQRLTTLTLLLIHLHHLQDGQDERVEVQTLVYSEKFGRAPPRSRASRWAASAPRSSWSNSQTRTTFVVLSTPAWKRAVELADGEIRDDLQWLLELEVYGLRGRHRVRARAGLTGSVESGRDCRPSDIVAA